MHGKERTQGEKEVFKLDPFSPCLFAFCNRRGDKIKILY
ncbi:MAG: transposase [Firmicutes bacterium]|nr:transposase [Bacillota bacterium]